MQYTENIEGLPRVLKAVSKRTQKTTQCQQIGDIGSKTSDFERIKKAVFESDKEISEIGQREFLKYKALTI